MAALDESLSHLDGTLTERVSVPLNILETDYTGIPGSQAVGNLYYRYLATAWVGPWGATIPWLLPPSSITNDSKVTLRLPQSRVRHFLCDASLFITGSVELPHPRIVSATLRLGPEKVIQHIDSEFACNIAFHYKHGGDIVTTDAKENSVTLSSPLFFEAPLKVLPLFVPNTPLPEIEYSLSTTGDNKDLIIRFLAVIVTSPGEADILPTPSSQHDTSPAVQYLPSFTTFSHTITESQVVSIAISTPPGKLARALYIRAFNTSCEDIPDAIASIDIVGPPPRSKSLIGDTPLPGSICRNKLKNQFLPPPSSSKVSIGDPLKLPYYVYPFAATPGGNVADYGVVLVPGTTLVVTLHPNSGATNIEACVETVERVEWKKL